MTRPHSSNPSSWLTPDFESAINSYFSSWIFWVILPIGLGQSWRSRSSDDENFRVHLLGEKIPSHEILWLRFFMMIFFHGISRSWDFSSWDFMRNFILFYFSYFHSHLIRMSLFLLYIIKNLLYWILYFWFFESEMANFPSFFWLRDLIFDIKLLKIWLIKLVGQIVTIILNYHHFQIFNRLNFFNHFLAFTIYSQRI